MRDPSRPWTRQQSFFRIVRSGREALRNGKQRENSPKPQGILRGRGLSYKHGTHSMNKECVCSTTVPTIECCGRCTGSAGGPSAGAANRIGGRSPARGLEGIGPVHRPKGGASVLRTGGRPHRSQAPSPHAPRGRPPVLAGAPKTPLHDG
jgi:hypothetical protein